MQVPHHREEWFQTYFPHLFCIKEDCLSLLLLNCWSRFTFCQCLIVELGLTVVHSGRHRLIYSTKRKRKQKQKQNGYVRDTQGCKWEGGCEHDQNCWFKITEFGIGRYFWSLVLITYSYYLKIVRRVMSPRFSLKSKKEFRVNKQAEKRDAGRLVMISILRLCWIGE